MKNPAPIRLDFVAAVTESRAAGRLLLLVGLSALIAVGFAFNQQLGERAVLEAKIESLPRVKRSAPVKDPKLVAELNTVEHELKVPWTPLLNELESASHDLQDSVSVLSVAPDAQKHTVRVVAEVRQLPDAIRYLERLQQSKLLRYPMLESHERRKDDPEHPIRIKLSAEWRT